jgi:hypothetical protein
LKILRMTLFLTPLTLSVSLFYGCSGNAYSYPNDGNSAKVSPSQNRALQSFSPSKTASDDHKEYRFIQKSTNEWIKNEWEPLTEGNNTITKSNKNYNSVTQDPALEGANSSTNLQQYVDKAGLFIENKEIRDANKTKVPSHTEKISKLPGIEQRTGR